MHKALSPLPIGAVLQRLQGLGVLIEYVQPRSEMFSPPEIIMSLDRSFNST